MIEVGKYNRESTNTDFDSDLVVEGVVLEILSLNTLLKIFKNSSIVNLTTEALKQASQRGTSKKEDSIFFQKRVYNH